MRLTVTTLVLLTLLVSAANIIYHESQSEKPTERINSEEITFAQSNLTTSNPEKETKSLNQQILDYVVIKEEDREKASPSNWIKEDQIKVYDNKIIIEIDNAQWARFTDTNSMDPFFDSEANAIEIVPKSADQIRVGDIISFTTNYMDGTIIHRVIEKGIDEKGIYFITKGDNNENADPGKTYFENVKRVLVAIIY